MKKIDLLGQTFGQWTVLEEYGKRSNWGKVLWRCLCSCGKEDLISGSNLKRGRSTRCRSCAIKDPLGEAGRNRVYKNYKNNAQSRNHVFELSLEEFVFITKQDCHYCGAVPTVFKRSSKIPSECYTGNGIDRKDNKEGYTLSNSLPCCEYCNVAKSDHSYEDYVAWIHRSSTYLVWGRRIL